jgi:hypothetical protein
MSIELNVPQIGHKVEKSGGKRGKGGRGLRQVFWRRRATRIGEKSSLFSHM